MLPPLSSAVHVDLGKKPVSSGRKPVIASSEDRVCGLRPQETQPALSAFRGTGCRRCSGRAGCKMRRAMPRTRRGTRHRPQRWRADVASRGRHPCEPGRICPCCTKATQNDAARAIRVRARSPSWSTTRCATRSENAGALGHHGREARNERDLAARGSNTIGKQLDLLELVRRVVRLEILGMRATSRHGLRPRRGLLRARSAPRGRILRRPRSEYAFPQHPRRCAPPARGMGRAGGGA